MRVATSSGIRRRTRQGAEHAADLLQSVDVRVQSTQPSR